LILTVDFVAYRAKADMGIPELKTIYTILILLSLNKDLSVAYCSVNFAILTFPINQTLKIRFTVGGFVPGCFADFQHYISSFLELP
jgi:hypothetical protein